MQQKYNDYAGQIVTQGHMDDRTDAVEDAERDLAFEAGLLQAKASATPGAEIFGGIRNGLVVTKNPSTKVDVTPGNCRDDARVRVELPLAATVLMTKAGATDAADYTDAISASGVDILTACPVGRYIVASLFLVKDEVLSDLQQDETLVWVYHSIQESFHFSIELGTSFNPAAVPVVPNRASLSDGKVLLSDVLILNVAGNLVIQACCASSADWDALAGNFMDWSGRRSDWFAAEIDDTNLDYQIEQIRGGSAREVLYDVLQLLQRNTAALNSGASTIGAPGRTVSLSELPAVATVLTQGTIETQLAVLLSYAANTLVRGGNNTLKPYGSVDGITAVPTMLNATKAMYVIQALQDAGAADVFRLGKLRGHISLPDVFYENWLSTPAAASGLRSVPDFTHKTWQTILGGTGAVYLRNSNDGAPNHRGILELQNTAGGDSAQVYSHIDKGGVRVHGGWTLGSSPWGVFVVRVRVSSVAAGFEFQVGMMTQGGISFVRFRVDRTLYGNSNWHLDVTDGAANNIATDTGEACAADTWYTLRLAMLSTTQIAYQINNGSEGVHTAANAMATNPYVLESYTTSNVGGTYGLIQEIMAHNGLLQADKY